MDKFQRYTSRKQVQKICMEKLAELMTIYSEIDFDKIDMKDSVHPIPYMLVGNLNGAIRDAKSLRDRINNKG